MDISEIRAWLFSMRDAAYGDFVSSLIPTMDRKRIIGVRTPALRAFSKKLDPRDARAFMNACPHDYYEENNLHAFLIERLDDYETTINETERFLPYVDNWASCDSMRPKLFSRHTDELYTRVLPWIESPHTYTVRYGVGMLCSYYLGSAFEPCQLELACSIESDEYYINMMVAWYFATALAKQREAALPYFTDRLLREPVYGMACRKAIESFRVSDGDKALIRQLSKKQRNKIDK